MNHIRLIAICISFILPSAQSASAQSRPTTYRTATSRPLPREQWNAPLVDVKREGDTWTLAGKRHKLTLNGKTLAMSMRSGETTWAMQPSAAGDLIVKSSGKEFQARLADASKIDVVPYDTGFKTGVKLRLSGW